MPSALFHLAVGLLIGLAVLGDDMDRRALAVIAFASLLPDLDAIIAVWIHGAHRTYLHNVFVFLVPGIALILLRPTHWMQRLKTWWPDAERVLWIALLTLTVAGIGLDAVASGTNLFYPVHDQYYQVHGTVSYSAQQGVTQTVTDVERAKVGSTQDTYYASGFEPIPDPDPANRANTVPLFENTLQLLLFITVFSIISYRTGFQWLQASKRRTRMVLPYTTIKE